MRYLKHPVVLAASFLAGVLLLRYFEVYSVLRVLHQLASWGLVMFFVLLAVSLRREIAEFLGQLVKPEHSEMEHRLPRKTPAASSEPDLLDKHPGFAFALCVGAVILMIGIWRWSIGEPSPSVIEYSRTPENPVTSALIDFLRDSWLLIVICVGILFLACSGNTSVGTAQTLFTLAVVGLSFLAMAAIVTATIAKFKAELP